MSLAASKSKDRKVETVEKNPSKSGPESEPKFKEIRAHAYEIDIVDDAINREGIIHTEIQLWCLNRENQSILCRVRDFPNICLAELPTIYDSVGNMIKWNDYNAKLVYSSLCYTLEKKNMGMPYRSNYLTRSRLYYYTNVKYPYLLLCFHTREDMMKASGIAKRLKVPRLNNGRELKIIFRETDVEIENKMFSMRNCGTTGRFKVLGTEIPYLMDSDPDDFENINPERISKKHVLEYEVDWKTFEKLTGEEANWITYPKVLSYDIESYSHRKRAFPQKGHPEDICFSIAYTIQRYKKPETEKRVCIIMGPTEDIKWYSETTNKDEKAEIYHVNNELEVLKTFFRLIDEEDPDVIIGYNIFGFDYDYIDARLEDICEEWPAIGRLMDKECVIEEKKWKSSAYGYVTHKYLKCWGRVSIDMLPYIKRDYKLSMYNLSHVGKYFLGDDKTDLKAYDMFCHHENIVKLVKKLKKDFPEEESDIKRLKQALLSTKNKNEKKRIEEALEGNTLVAEYNIQDTALVLKLFEKMNVWINIIELSDIVRVTPIQFFTRGQQLRCVAQLYHEASHRGIVLTQREKEFMYAKGAWVGTPIIGYWPLVICLDFNSLYPSIMIAYNICFTTLLRTMNGVDPEIYNKISVDQEEPLVVKKPKNDNFDYEEFGSDDEDPEIDPEIDPDFDPDFDPEIDDEDDIEINESGKIRRLDDSAIMKEGISEVKSKEKKKGKKKKKSEEKIMRHYDFGFVKPEVKKGLLPEIEENLLENRRKAKKEIKRLKKVISEMDKDAPDYFEKLEDLQLRILILDAQQLGLKISCNSLYGFTGAQTMGKYSLAEATICITSLGRDLINLSSEFFSKHYNATTVYGDSVLPNEPILVRKNNKIEVMEISSLFDEEKKKNYEGFKAMDKGRSEKEQSISDYQVWSSVGWTNINRVIRHKTKKRIFRVVTDLGFVEVTEDHSLLDNLGSIKKPGESKEGDLLLHSYPIETRTCLGICPNTFWSSGDKLNMAKSFLQYSKSGRYLKVHGNLNGSGTLVPRNGKETGKILHIIDLGEYSDYVYDLETAIGNYQAGVGEIIVKNTDSVFLYVPEANDDPKNVWDIAYKLQNHINGSPAIYDEQGNLVKAEVPSIFPKPLFLEAEKIQEMILMKKKHYIYIQFDEDGNHVLEKQTKEQKEKGLERKAELNSKGVLIARRDNCKWVRDIYEEIARDRFAKKGIVLAYEKLVDKAIEAIELNLDIAEELSVVKSMGANYKNKSYTLSVFSELMKGLGKPIQPGERFPYVIVKDHQGRKKVGYCMRTIEMFKEEYEAAGITYGEKIPRGYKPPEDMYPPEEIDSFYYMNNILEKPLDRLFYYAYINELKEINHILYKPEKNKQLGKISIAQPVKMLCQIFKEYKKIIAEDGISVIIPVFKKYRNLYRLLYEIKDNGVKIEEIDSVRQIMGWSGQKKITDFFGSHVESEEEKIEIYISDSSSDEDE